MYRLRGKPPPRHLTFARLPFIQLNPYQLLLYLKLAISSENETTSTYQDNLLILKHVKHHDEYNPDEPYGRPCLYSHPIKLASANEEHRRDEIVIHPRTWDGAGFSFSPEYDEH